MQYEAFLGDKDRSWTALDKPIWIKRGPEEDDIIDGTEEFFTVIYNYFC